MEIKLSRNSLNRSIVILDCHFLVFDLGLDKFELRIVNRIAKELDLMAGLAVMLMLEVLVIAPFGREDDVASRDEEEPRGILALGDEEAAGTLNQRCGIGTDGETERGSKRFAGIFIRFGIFNGIGRVDGREEFGTG